jgi:hypothetical protein
VNANLNSLFKRKIAVEVPAPVQSVQDDSEEDELNDEKADQLRTEIKQVGKKAKSLKAEKKFKKPDLESEKRTVFIGNLHKDCKKTVNTTRLIYIVINSHYIIETVYK